MNDDFDVNAFFEHFKNISNTSHISGNGFQLNNEQNVNIETLDAPFTTVEIQHIVKSLKRNKSPDLEQNVADFFIR